MARRACAAHVAPARCLHRLCIVVQIGMHPAQDVPDGVHVARANGMATPVGDVAGDTVGVLVASQALDGLGHELYSDHASASRASHSRLVTGRSISPLWSMSKSQYSICISSERSYHSPSMTTLCITMPIS